MTIGLVGRKSGMTRIFTEEGVSIPVSVVEVEPNRITQVKTAAADGYDAVQVTVGERRATRVNKCAAGHFSKAETGAGRGLWEMRFAGSDDGLTVGSQLTVERFEPGQKIDVTGQSKGKGFQGGIKRWNFTMQDATHGNSLSHRSNGSIGQCQTPGRVFKGKKMSGHMGAEQVTVQNLEVVRVDAERNLILVKGAIPGAPGGDVLIKPAVKAKA
ncbi:MAG: 50S ribosomal protein L3 [Pseudomonadales bacterium]